ncbi:MAG: hypothetical protein JRJ86_04645 [Deltaproteobacteria bacterium]|nr:hypothetical protein [Deltaproteobacteria bacterium]MBW2117407.1 hypothetical protein [Deltaproteobacteria bacterium]MBW2343813.1 hypothetical protein [Deltaproteobacteria bacterium]
MTKEYVHVELNKEVEAISGHYLFEAENVLKHNGREVLYLIGHAVMDTSCCGVGGCRYALVPGYLIEWKNKKDHAGNPVSEVEPISDDKSKSEIQSMIKEIEIINQIQFY